MSQNPYAPPHADCRTQHSLDWRGSVDGFAAAAMLFVVACFTLFPVYAIYTEVSIPNAMRIAMVAAGLGIVGTVVCYAANCLYDTIRTLLSRRER